MTRSMDNRDLGKPLKVPGLPFPYQGPPALFHPLLVLLSSRAVTAAKDKPVWEVKRKDRVPV